MHSSNFIRALFCVAAAAASTVAVSQQAHESAATGKATSASPRQTSAPSRVILSQPGNGHGTLQPGNGHGTLQPGNGHGTLQPGNGQGTLRGGPPRSMSSATAVK